MRATIKAPEGRSLRLETILAFAKKVEAGEISLYKASQEFGCTLTLLRRTIDNPEEALLQADLVQSMYESINNKELEF